MILTLFVGRVWVAHYVLLELCIFQRRDIFVLRSVASVFKIVQNDFDDRLWSVAGARYRNSDSNECGWLHLSRTDRMLSGAFEIAFSSQIVHKSVYHQHSSLWMKYFVHLQHQVVHPHP